MSRVLSLVAKFEALGQTPVPGATHCVSAPLGGLTSTMASHDSDMMQRTAGFFERLDYEPAISKQDAKSRNLSQLHARKSSSYATTSLHPVSRAKNMAMPSTTTNKCIPISGLGGNKNSILDGCSTSSIADGDRSFLGTESTLNYSLSGVSYGRHLNSGRKILPSSFFADFMQHTAASYSQVFIKGCFTDHSTGSASFPRKNITIKVGSSAQRGKRWKMSFMPPRISVRQLATRFMASESSISTLNLDQGTFLGKKALRTENSSVAPRHLPENANKYRKTAYQKAYCSPSSVMIKSDHLSQCNSSVIRCSSCLKTPINITGVLCLLCSTRLLLYALSTDAPVTQYKDSNLINTARATMDLRSASLRMRVNMGWENSPLASQSSLEHQTASGQLKKSKKATGFFGKGLSSVGASAQPSVVCLDNENYVRTRRITTTDPFLGVATCIISSEFVTPLFGDSFNKAKYPIEIPVVSIKSPVPVNAVHTVLLQKFVLRWA